MYSAAQRSLVTTIIRRNMSHVSRPSKLVDKFVRVDHAGELGADRIYAGQMAVLGKIYLKFLRQI